MRLFETGFSELHAVSDKGTARFLSDDGAWLPETWSRPMALEVLGDERAIELSPEEAAAALARRGASMPSLD
jgi:hypothetical protein